MKFIGWAGKENDKLYGTLEDALAAAGPRNVAPVIECEGNFWDDPENEGHPFGSPKDNPKMNKVVVSLAWAKKQGLITPEQFKKARGK